MAKKKLRRYDQLITCCHFKPESKQLLLSTALPMTVLVNIESGAVVKLPSSSRHQNDVAISCLIASNSSTLVVLYERNHVEVFEAVNGQVSMHDWSRSNQIPANFYRQYN